ncbi:transcriptional regulator, AsnC family [Pyrolobus fumarii 1A]|uniref:Transcriptional regulator, AsnC family n=1 Tax=Pyrolobus fumarii (strain DSM 11204 / 1A) TaxID=694429 RepID=G0EEZ6_PYRF1|nr:Lrp/AsnC family transcriptional regulator [Pyrolobus fumarii]AEM38110.1 transcriptional regulator, AsnC family [Pyrolobus fumarii 1A]
MVGKGELDEKDMVILAALSRNARVSYTELAKQLGISDVAVIKRIRRLEQLGVIKRYTIVVDPKALGYNVVSYTGIDVEPEHLLTVANELRKKEYVKMLAITSGDHDIMALIWARDSEELRRIHEEISRMPGVKRICPAIVLETLKDGDWV